jgi:hypothetical protein
MAREVGTIPTSSGGTNVSTGMKLRRCSGISLSVLANDTLPDDPGTLKAMLLAERARAERLEQIIQELRRHRFGRRAETLPEDQLLLGLEDVEQVAASSEAEGEAAVPDEQAKRAATSWRAPRAAARY